MRIGQGYDVHRLTEGRKLILGGVDIPYEKGFWAIQMQTYCCTPLWMRSWGGCPGRYRAAFPGFRRGV